jgi:SNF2 family DNA or RNA helicase
MLQQDEFYASDDEEFDLSDACLVQQPLPHQRRAVQLIERATNTTAKAVLTGDPPGLGKTLPAMIAIVRARKSHGRYSIVVAPASCIEQWCQEFETFFVHVSTMYSACNVYDTNQNQGTIRVLALRDPSIPPTTSLNYDVVICSYHFMISNCGKIAKHYSHIADFGSIGLKPERSNIALYSEIYSPQDFRSPFIIFDECNAFKNMSGKTFEAATALRAQCETCVMLTGSPIDNHWHDVFTSLQFVDGHNMQSKTEFL